MPAQEPLHRKITRNLIGFLSVFCQINIQEHNEIDLFMAGGRRRKRHISAKRGAPLCAKLVVCLYVYLNVRVCSVLYWQYQYDYDFTKLKQIDAKLASINVTCGNLNRTHRMECLEFNRISKIREFHQERYGQLGARVKSLGQPWLDLHWVGPGSGSVILLLAFIIYMGYILLVHFKLMKPLDLYFVRMVLSTPYDAMKCRRLVKACAKRLIDSSRNYVLNEIERSEEIVEIVKMRASSGNMRTLAAPSVIISAKASNDHHDHCPGRLVMKAGNWLSIGQIRPDSRLAAQLQNNIIAIDHLQDLLRNGQLAPLNRTQENVDQMSLKFALLAISNLIYSFIFDSLLLHGLPAYFNQFHLDTWMDLLTYLELWAITEISVLAITFYVVVLIVVTNDQMKYIVQLEKRIKECIVENDKLFGKHKQEHNAGIDFINRNLVRILAEYEIFLAQFKPVQATFSFVAMGSTVVAMCGPLMFRLHIMYTEGRHHSLGFYFCAVGIGFTDQLLLPLTRINDSSRTLYARMSSLLAQAIEFNMIMMMQRHDSPRLVDQHLIWQLRNILIDSKKFTQQFAAHVTPSIPLTVPNFIKLHYWYVLSLLSYYFKLDSWKTILGDTQDDPLNLFGAL